MVSGPIGLTEGGDGRVWVVRKGAFAWIVHSTESVPYQVQLQDRKSLEQCDRCKVMQYGLMSAVCCLLFDV